MSIFRASLVMASGTVASRVLGFIRVVLLSAAIGVTTDAADAFGVANQLPNNVYAIIAGGVLNAVLIPQIVKARAHLDGGKSYIDRLLTFVLTVFAIVTVLTTIAAPLLVRLYTSEWSDEQLALATAFAYWCLPQLFFYGLYSLLGEVLNAKSAFGPYMWAPVLNNLIGLGGLVAYILIFAADPTGTRAISAWGGDQIALLGGSATIGVAAQAFILLFAWRKIGMSLNLNFKWRGFGLGPALRAASWSFAMVLVSQLGGLVQTVVASRTVAERDSNLAIASVAAAFIAWLIFMLPHSVVTVSIATAYFTKLSHHVQDQRMDEYKSDLRSGLGVILLFAAIASAGLVVLAYPMARVFSGEYPALVALGNVLLATMLGLVPFSFVYMMQRAFYALEDTRTPFWFTVVQISLHITGAIILGFTMPAQYLVASLALLTSLTVTIQAVVARSMLLRRVGKIEKLAGPLPRALLAAAIAGGAGWLVLQAFGGTTEGSFALDSVLNSGLAMLVVAVSMLLCYALALWLFRVRELREVIAVLRGIGRN